MLKNENNWYVYLAFKEEKESMKQKGTLIMQLSIQLGLTLVY